MPDGPALTIDTSVERTISVVSLPSLLVPSGSTVSLLTDAVLVTVVAAASASTCTVIATESVAPTPSGEASAQVTTCTAALQPGPETKLRPAGSVSVTTGFTAGDGPSLRTSMV